MEVRDSLVFEASRGKMLPSLSIVLPTIKQIINLGEACIKTRSKADLRWLKVRKHWR